MIQNNGHQHHRSQSDPEPTANGGALPSPLEYFTEALDEMDVLLNSSFEAEEPEIRFYNWATGKLQLQQGELNYNTCMKFLASYVALEIFVIGATGTPPATLYGPISKSQSYPVDRCLEIWNAVNEDATKLYAIRNVLKRICDRSDTHPFKSVNG